MDMVAALVRDHETVAKSAAAAIAVAEQSDDEPTAGLAADRQQIHERRHGCCAATSSRRPTKITLSHRTAKIADARSRIPTLSHAP